MRVRRRHRIQWVGREAGVPRTSWDQSIPDLVDLGHPRPWNRVDGLDGGSSVHRTSWDRSIQDPGDLGPLHRVRGAGALESLHP